MRRIIIVVVLLGIPAVAYATQVSGDVWGVWDSTMNPIEVIGELRVPADSSLIIEPGCYIEFQDYYALTLDTSAAFIKAIGTEEDSIVFTPAPGIVWNGIDIFFADSTCEFSYCVLERSYAPIEDPMSPGGAIHCWQTNLDIKNCRITNNRAESGRGGGIFISSGDLFLTSSIISDNLCAFGGSGLCSEYGDVDVINSVFQRDTTWYPLGGEEGGAIRCTSSPHVNLFGNRFIDNFSYIIGNWITADTATVDSNVFIRNDAFTAGGGLILSVEDSASVMHNLFEDNWVGSGSGGGLCFRGDNSVITENIFRENRAAKGGGLYLEGSHIRVFQNLLAFNIGGVDGGGVYINGTNITLRNNVISYNSANGAGGVYSDNSSPFTPITMTNNIVWGNTAASWPHIYIRHHPLEVSYCDVEGGWPGVGNINIDPLFRDTANGDFHLMSTACGDPYDSPCIDVGDPTIQDIILDCDWGLGNQTSDMGAYGGGDSLISGVLENHIRTPDDFFMLQNYPNPFNATTTIKYFLKIDSNIKIEIFNILGQRIGILYDGFRNSGEHILIWDAADHPSGLYFARIETADHSQNKKMILLK